jgi:cytochrome c oxidase subunit 2
MPMNRKWTWLAAPVVAIVCGALGFAVAGWADDMPVQQVKMIKMSAKRFVFVPNQLTLKKGETVEIDVTTEDVPMGFSVPDLNARTDVPPDAVAHVRLTPQKTGTFPFLCDIFCGSGHEDMNGVITVVD